MAGLVVSWGLNRIGESQFRRPRARLLLIASMLSAGFPAARADDVIQLLEPAKAAFRGPTDPIEIHFAGSPPEDLAPHFRFELDAVDVTALVTRAGNTFSYRPLERIAPGAHQFRLAAYLPDGQVFEVGYWDLEVRASERFREASVSHQLDLQAAYQIAGDYNNEDERTAVNGNWRPASLHADQDWTLSSAADFYYSNHPEAIGSEREFDLNEYLIAYKSNQSSAALGHVTVDEGSVVLSGFSTRGLAASRLVNDGKSRISLFTGRTEQITGIDHTLGFDDPAHRTSGITYALSPVNNHDRSVQLKAVYVSGRGSEAGSGDFAESEARMEGDAMAVVADSAWANRTWRLRGELAHSRHDFADAADQESAQASSLLLEKRNQESDALQWRYGVLVEKIDPWFRSPANPGILPDRQRRQVFASVRDSNWSSDVSFLSEEDNVEDDDTLPTARANTLALQAALFPQTPEEAATSGLFAAPNYTLGYTQTSLEQIRLPEGYAESKVDNQQRNISFLAAFSPEGGYWAIGHEVSLFDDDADPNNDSVNRATSLDIGIKASDDLGLGYQAQYSRFRWTAQDLYSTSTLHKVTLTADLGRGVAGHLSHTLNREALSDDTVSTRTNTTEVSLIWDYRRPSENTAGLAFYLSGIYRDTGDIEQNDHDYRLDLGIKTSLPLYY